MKIGELAALVGVSTRTVRHYHQLGLLPEPERLLNGYRDYRLRDAVTLARVRRLAELGLSLDEIRDVLTDDRGRDLREVLQELDADLGREQAAIAARRARLAALLAESDLHVDSTVSPELAEVLRHLPAGSSGTADVDRQLLTLLDAGSGGPDGGRLTEVLRPLTTPGAAQRTRDLYARLDELVDARPADPRVAALAADLAAHLPEDMVSMMAEGAADAEADHWLAAMTRELSPAQAETLRLLLAMLRRRR